MMIEVNFLPLEERKKKNLPKIPAGLPLKIFYLFLVILASIHLVIFLVTFAQDFYLNRLTIKVNEKLPKSAEAATMKQTISSLEKEVLVFDEFFGKNIIWAEKLNIISDVMPIGIWLNRIIINDNLFSMDGTAVSLKGEEMKMISVLLEALKAKDSFYDGFEDLTLKSIQRRYIKSIEVVDFIIAGLLKE
ncbi:MAG: PilN domain-containing protein [Candidatus Omnitrophica bacterium]|nr:PilN domain-containing protein [Candidatus Omnitrophota bacterium]